LPEFRVFETAEFDKRFNKLSRTDALFLRRKLESYVYPQLKANPFTGRHIKKLRAYSPQTWRYRLGRFRLFYVVDQGEKIVYLLTIEDRKDAN